MLGAGPSNQEGILGRYHRSSSARREPRPPLHQGRRLLAGLRGRYQRPAPVRADRRDLASNRVLRTRGWRPLPEAPGSLIHLSRVPLLTGLVAAPPRTPQRNRNELGETTVNRKRRKPMSQQENQQLRRCSLRSGRRGRRFESCHSDHCSCHSFYWLFLIAGGSRVNRRFLIRSGHKPAFSRRGAPEACQNLVPREEGAGNAGCTLHPRSRVQ